MEERSFGQGQRQVVPKKGTVRGKRNIRFVSELVPVVEQMVELFAYAVGREMRRTKARGVEELSRLATSAKPAPPATVADDLF